MTILVGAGVLLTLTGLGGLVYCIVVAAGAKRAGLTGEAMEARLRKLVPLNLAALGVSTIGLMAVVLGLFLG
ncbi:hypothetical protein JANAI62_11200 [Jannaschia pagri]|uniref:Uncharacterized protein n=1 Tax=Jannaschia pagri TaxID=2829797 RepID=A0ABQ4NK78_9RHOB|nr:MULTISPECIES: hypothetical protein [unclassified Jannaschia]GIT90665.1 hypothetical protein JANAI61_11230 [Jannaschia sp. AI_61]GIT94497.1 hypothetical protein JANAI62_11200 [Jannaschia sp. AI_62]